MFGECHAHMLMDGIDYREAVKLHRESVCESKIREYFEAYRRAGVSFVRDGGDNCVVLRSGSGGRRFYQDYDDGTAGFPKPW